MSTMPAHAPEDLANMVQSKRTQIVASMEDYESFKSGYEVRICAAFASGVITLQELPPKLNPIIRSIMNSIKVDISIYPWHHLTFRVIFMYSLKNWSSFRDAVPMTYVFSFDSVSVGKSLLLTKS